LAALQSYYFENYYTDAERLAAQQKIAAQEVANFNKNLGLTGTAAIDTKDELRAYIQSLDLTTDAGGKAYVEALKLAEAITTVDATSKNATEALDKMTTAGEELIQSWLDLSDSITQLMRDITFSAQSPLPASGQYALLMKDIEKLRESYYRASDEERAAIGQKLVALYRQAFDLLPSAFQSNEDYLKEWTRLSKELADLGTDARSQLDVLLDGLKWDEKIYDALKSIDTQLAAFLANIGNYQKGLEYVPNDNFLAKLHTGERILTSTEAKDYAQAINFNAKPVPVASNTSNTPNQSFTVNMPITVTGSGNMTAQQITQQLRPIVVAEVRKLGPYIKSQSRFQP
jgi:hypothetical protein